MNDPHIQALIYRVVHSQNVQYEKAVPFEHDGPRFRVTVDNGIARFQMKEHFADVASARSVVDPFIDSWELSASLEIGPGAFELDFLSADVIDRHPTPGVVSLMGVSATAAVGTLSVVIGQPRYPEPAPHLVVDGDVEWMSYKFANYYRGKETLPAVGYSCFTVLKSSARGQGAAAKKYKIALDVLRKLSELTSIKGGTDARKAEGRFAEYTEAERAWIEAVLPMLIRRAAEVAGGHGELLPEITMANFRPL